MQVNISETLSRLVIIEGEKYLFCPEYAVRVEIETDGYSVSAYPNSFEGHPAENHFVGGRTPVIIARGLSETELDTLFSLLDADFAHATETMLRDAQDGCLGDPTDIVGWDEIRSCRVDYMLYLSGVGEEARNHTNDGALREEAAEKLDAHWRTRDAHGVIGKGIPRDSRGYPLGDVMFGYDGALQQAIDRWLADGHLLAAVNAPGPDGG